MSLLRTSPYARIELIEEADVVLVSRSELPFGDVPTTRREITAWVDALAGLALDELGLLFDWRYTPMTSDPEILREVVARGDALALRFARHALLLTSSLSAPQAERVARAGSSVAVYTDAQAAWLHVRGATRAAVVPDSLVHAPRAQPAVHLYLARHGRTHWNELGRFQGHTDVPLDDVGRAQARALADQLRGRVEAVLTSDLLRASETARIVADALAIPLLAADPDLRERGYGAFEGLTRDEISLRFPEAWALRARDRDHEPPGGEPRAEVVARMQRGLARAVATVRARHQHALIVGHGSSLRMFIEALTSAPVASFANMEFREVRHDGASFQLVSPESLPRVT